VRGEQMQEKLRYVQEFAQIGEYFDQPVSTYSAGMRARLAFGTSMAFKFDYYLIDEILAVGDAFFKAKSRQTFAERLKESRMIMVSHNMKLIQKMCDAIVFLDRGRAVYFPDLQEGIAAYEAMGAEA
jgi:capsular polysaccharide transport system ATP-binding protein